MNRHPPKSAGGRHIPMEGRARVRRTGLGVVRRLWAGALLLVVPAACASAQGPPAQDATGQDERIRPPETIGQPGTRVQWVEGGLRDESTDPPVVHVQARGEVEVDPDRARISFAVETEAESARDAADENARRMARVLAAVREEGRGVEGFRAETSGYSLHPRYRTERQTSIREIAGYTARNHIVITVDAVDQVGRLIDAALQNGANRMAGLHFSIRDPEPHREAALREAMRKAQAEARVMAEALGMRLGAPIHVTAGAETPMPRARADMVMAMEMLDTAAPTPIEAGTQTIGAQVSIRFRLEPAR